MYSRLAPCTLLFALAVPTAGAQSGGYRPVESTYVSQYVPLPIAEIEEALQGLRERAEQNEDRLVEVLTWIYELKPLAVQDPTLFQALVGYQQTLEQLQTGGLAGSRSAIREVEVGVRRAISDARMRAQGGQRSTSTPRPTPSPQPAPTPIQTGRTPAEQAWADAHARVLRDSPVLSETFNTATNGWQVVPGRGEQVELRAGFYSVGVTDRDQWHYFTAPVRALTTAREVAIDAPIRRTRKGGMGPRSLGLIWGMANNLNYHALLIDPDRQTAVVIRVEGGRSATLVAEHRTNAVLPGSAQNRLAVTRVGDQMTFSVNGEIIGLAPATALAGNEVGYWVGPDQMIIADSITVGAR